ncbi:cytoplasmic protein [Thelephora terrestris]|uniref:Cytoplasmic protein n=1 Tax=Thelephora terrestris TaxID=56493 RepID=A0A9P6H9A5_9AGAM|nr:cytoplasmic protein [Thelephora terrestris]
MVLFFSSGGDVSKTTRAFAFLTLPPLSPVAHDPAVVIYAGKDKHENEDLIKFAWPQDVWFHVDKLSSAHVYLRMPDGMAWDGIPEPLLVDCAQLVKANSIEGNKKDNITVIYTPADNLKKTGDMQVGQVSFHDDKKASEERYAVVVPFLSVFARQVRSVYIQKRENPIVNRLNKTKVEREVDHEQERQERIKRENAVKRAAAAAKKTAEAELAEQRKAEKAARSYDILFDGADEDDVPKKSVREMEDDFM